MPSEEVQADRLPNSRDEVARGMIGRVIGDFQIRREIGRGGMGIVYEAVQRSLDRVVAVKVLTAPVGTSEAAKARFKREAQAAAKLHHANIVPIYAQGESDGIFYYAMELVRGRTVHQIIDEARGAADANRLGATETRILDGSRASLTGSASASWTQGPDAGTGTSPNLGSDSTSTTTVEELDNVARLTATVADALEYAHNAGVIHRDIKPHNLILGNDGRLCVSDFGLARVREEPGLTLTTEFLGSPLYMSSEQVSGGASQVDHRTDVYSLGVTLYEWLTLRPPFRGERRDQVVNQILYADPIPPRALNPSIPAALETICLKAIERDPKRRYQTAAEMAADLRAYVQRQAIKARPPGLFIRLTKVAQRRRVAILGASLVLVCGLFAVSKYSDWSESRRVDRTPTAPRPAVTTPTPYEPRTSVRPEQPSPSGLGDRTSVDATLSPVPAARVEPLPRPAESPPGLLDLEAALEAGASRGDELRAALSPLIGADDGSLAAQLDAFERYVAGELANVLAGLHAPVAQDLMMQPDRRPADEAYFQAATNESADDQAALQRLDEALQQDPKHYFARHLRAVLLCRRFRFQEMLAEARTLVELRPNQPPSHMILGTSLLLTGDYQEALAQLEATRELQQADTAWLLTLKGLCYARQGNLTAAIAAYSRAINEFDGEHAVARFARGRVQAYQGDYEAALANAERVVELLPNSPEAYTFRGECYDNLGQYESASNDYAKAIELGGDEVRLLGKQLLAAFNLKKQEEERAAAKRGPEAQRVQPEPAADERQQPPPPREPSNLNAVEDFLRNLMNGGQSSPNDRRNGRDELPVP